MKFKHTPGPWAIRTSPITDTENWVYAINSPKNGGDVICDPPNMESSLYYWPANAKLIAAAPDLLEALNELMTPVDTIAAVPEGTTFTVTFTVAQINKARIAIKKATE